MERTFLVLAGISGFLAVGLGAFGAHGLERWLGELADGETRLGWWRTAAQYHLAHAPALAVVALLGGRIGGTAPAVAGWCFVAGTVLFSGSLYAMTLTGVRGLGAVTPIGGLLFLAGWAALSWAGFRAAAAG